MAPAIGTRRVKDIVANITYRLLVADVDGTLAEGGAPVPEPLVKALLEFRARGGLFTLATGRGPLAARRYLEQLAVTTPAILYNGAWLYDPVGRRPLSEKTLPAEFSATFLRWLATKALDVVAYRGEEVLVANLSPRLDQHFQKDGDGHRPVPGWDRVNPAGLNKFLLISSADPCLPFVQSFPREAAMVNWIQSENDYWEVLPAGVSKGSALRELAAYLDLSCDEVAAAGDHLNDREMLAAAGWGVAVQNAHPDLKAVARYVTAGRSWRGVLELLNPYLHQC